MKNSTQQKLAPEPAPLRALSIRQPWAWLILNAGKDIENRNWFSHYRGRFLIHAAKRCTRLEYQEAKRFLDRAGLNIKLPPLDSLDRGGIVGVAEIVDCVTSSKSPWFFGPYGFRLANVQPLPFQRCNGALGFFVPETVVQ